MKLRDGGDIMYLKGPEMRHKGFAIILVLATLVLLAMLSLTYIKLALIDRNIARNYMDNKRAQLIAQSGVDYALAKIQEDIFDTSWQEAKTITINGKNEIYTESAGSTYGQDRDIFAVQVKDSNSMINVNDGLGNDRVTANTKRILNVLGDVSGITTLGDKIIDKRPPQGYTSKQELLKAISAAELETIKDLVTTNAWQDENVANPVPLSDEAYAFGLYPVKYNQNIGRYRYGIGKSARGSMPEMASKLTMYQPTFTDTTWTFKYGTDQLNKIRFSIYGLDELNPQWIEIVSRSPVNINTASKEVLYTLLYKLQGFFISDRKRPYPSSGYSLITNTTCMAFPYGGGSGNQLRFGHLGFIYPTKEIVNDSGYNDPDKIADEMIKCREKRDEYSDSVADPLWFRGPFKTWRQFNAFCDYMTTRNVIKDTRTSIFIEYTGQSITKDYTGLSPIALKIATQAIADVLKANFNPNLHLNESNPDANLHTLADKTDLIVNSTEFCFTPMGYFDIESHGYILRSADTDNRIISEHKIAASVKLFDAYRETNQKQFLNHIQANADMTTYLGSSDTSTNNSRTIEIGPEPTSIIDFITYARENEYSGYIALPTLKGLAATGGVPLTLFTNLTTNFDAQDKTGTVVSINKLHNIGDPTEGPGDMIGIRGPYEYSARYRLARSYRQNDGKTYDSIAPADLRIDGAYLERYASLAYNAASSAIKNEGIASYWIKPWFYPESTGKPRTYFSLSKYTGGYCNDAFSQWISGIHPGFFFHLFLPASSGTHSAPAYLIHPSVSFLFAYTSYNANVSTADPNCGGHVVSMTKSLNHLSHYDGSGLPLSCVATEPRYFMKGHWIHVIIEWHVPSATTLTKIYVNGKQPTGTANYLSPGPPAQNHILPGSVQISDFHRSVLGIKMGEPGITQVTGVSETLTADDMLRNFTCDSTIDEFYIFDRPSNAFSDAQSMWLKGRYYKPVKPSTSTFTSQKIDLYSSQVLASPTTIPAPSLPLGSGVNTGVQNPRLIALAWTWYAEGVDTLTARKGDAIIKNYTVYENTQSSDPGIQSSTYLYPKVNLKLRLNGTDLATEFKDDGFSSVSNVEMKSTDDLRYKVIFNLENFDGTWAKTDRDNAILLYTPVFDDITIYYTQGTQFLSYRSE